MTKPISFLKLLFILFLQIASHSVKSQCGTQMSDQTFEKLKKHKEMGATLRTADAATLMYIPVKIHIITKDDGSGGVDMNEIFKGLMYTNSMYTSVNIQFYICGDVEYIKSTEFYTISSTTEAKYTPTYDVANICNIYYGGDVLVNGKSYGGYAYYPGGSLRIMINNSSAGDMNVLPHEMGHFWGLPHTFDNSNNADLTKRELVTRGTGSNCATAGDLICDTPADPFIDGTSNSYFPNCIYTEQHADLNGDQYAPMLDNLMSYYGGCSDVRLTQGQLAVVTSYKTDLTRTSMQCSGATVNAPTNLTATIDNLGIVLNWTDNATNELGFVVEVSQSQNGPFTAANFTLSNSTTCIYKEAKPFSQYFFRVKPINSASQYSNTASITTQKQYCAPTPQIACDQPYQFSIKEVDFYTETIVNNQSNCEPGGYAYFSAPSIKAFKGETYTIRVIQSENNSGSMYGSMQGLWIDYNDNGYFNDQGEFVNFQKTGFGEFKAMVKIPSGATIGTKRLRVRLVSANSGPDSSMACAAYQWGETEDYNLTIEEYPTQFPVNLTVTQPNKYQVKLSWSNPSLPNDAKCYLEKSSTLNGTYVVVDSTALSSTPYNAIVTANDGYYYRLRRASDHALISNKTGLEVTNYSIPFAITGNPTGNIVNVSWAGDSAFFKSAILQKSVYASGDLFTLVDTIKTIVKSYEDFKIKISDTIYRYRLVDLSGKAISDIATVNINNHYCMPTYSNTCYLKNWQAGVIFPNGIESFFISPACRTHDVLFDTRKVKSTETISVDIYNDFDCLFTNAAKTVQNNIAVWVDFNEDLIFSDAEKVVYKNYPQIDCDFIASIPMPQNIDGGAKRLRIISTPANVAIMDPCGHYVDGTGGDFYFIVEGQSIQTGVADKEAADNIKIYPNPSENGTVEIVSKHAIGSVQLYDNLGQLILQTKDSKIENLKSGFYLITVVSSDNEEIYRGKVLVK